MISENSFAMHADFRRRYDVLLTRDLLTQCASLVAEHLGSRAALIITTPTVGSFYGETLQAGLRSLGVILPMLVLDCDESSKTMVQVERICSEVFRHGLSRKSVLIGFGGGICTDLVTVAASLIRRGIPYFRIPTTLIGQVDAGIGLKGAVNACSKKSALGCFYPPESVFIDPALLQTLPKVHVSGGLAEIIKIGLVCQGALIPLLHQHGEELLRSKFARPRDVSREVMWLSIVKMLQELSANPYEDLTYKRLVDFGHTFSPLLETRSQFRLTHGEAVAIDMALSCILSNELTVLDDSSCERALSTIVAADLPISSPILTEELCIDAIREGISHRAGSLNLVLPACIGTGFFVEKDSEIPLSLIRSSLGRLACLGREWRQGVSVTKCVRIARAAPSKFSPVPAVPPGNRINPLVEQRCFKRPGI